LQKDSAAYAVILHRVVLHRVVLHLLHVLQLKRKQ